MRRTCIFRRLTQACLVLVIALGRSTSEAFSHGPTQSHPRSFAKLLTSTRPSAPLRTKIAADISSEPSPAEHDYSTSSQKRMRQNLSIFAFRMTRDNSESYGWTKQNLSIAVPALLGLLADPILSLVDTGFVGRFGPTNLAALGVCTSIFHMAFSIFRGSTVAAVSLVGGAKSEQEKRQITKTSLQLAGILGTLMLIVLRAGGPQILTAMGAPASSALYEPARDYLFARCWAAPAVVGIVVSEGVFRGSGDNMTPLYASGAAAIINLVLDPLFMFPMKLGMAGAAAATAFSQLGALGIYFQRIRARKMMPQPSDAGKVQVSTAKIVKAILGANLAMFAKSGSMLFFYAFATAQATRMGAGAAHQIVLSLWWMITFLLDSGSVSGQVLMGRSTNDRNKARSLTSYMLRYGLLQGVSVGAIIALFGRFLPAIFTPDLAVQSTIINLIPHIAIQQVLVSVSLCLEGLVLGDPNQFKFMAIGTTLCTAIGIRQLAVSTSIYGIWANAMTMFFVARLINAIIGVARVHRSIDAKAQAQLETYS